jgi:hypothetical protein
MNLGTVNRPMVNDRPIRKELIVSISRRQQEGRVPAGTLTIVTERPFVPADFVVPLELAEPGFRLVPLRPEHNAADHAAWSGSMEHIRATPGFAGRPWPHDMTAAQNFADLEQHAVDFAGRTGFTYTVLPLDRPNAEEVLGCVYVYPPNAGDHGDASVRSWVRADHAALDTVLYAAVRDWLARDWPFQSVDYDPR